MYIEIIKSLKERAKEMLEDNYNRKIGDEEIYTIICELENFYTAYEEKRKELKKEIQDDLDVRNRWGLTLQELEKEKKTSHYIQSQLDIANAKLVEEKEIIKNAICFLKYYNKDFNDMSDDEIKQILYSFGKCADIKKEE